MIAVAAQLGGRKAQVLRQPSPVPKVGDDPTLGVRGGLIVNSLHFKGLDLTGIKCGDLNRCEAFPS